MMQKVFSVIGPRDGQQVLKITKVRADGISGSENTVNEFVDFLGTISSSELDELSLEIIPKDDLQRLDTMVFKRLQEKCKRLKSFNIVGFNGHP